MLSRSRAMERVNGGGGHLCQGDLALKTWWLCPSNPSGSEDSLEAGQDRPGSSPGPSPKDHSGNPEGQGYRGRGWCLRGRKGRGARVRGPPPTVVPRFPSALPSPLSRLSTFLLSNSGCTPPPCPHLSPDPRPRLNSAPKYPTSPLPSSIFKIKFPSLYK